MKEYRVEWKRFPRGYPSEKEKAGLATTLPQSVRGELPDPPRGQGRGETGPFQSQPPGSPGRRRPRIR